MCKSLTHQDYLRTEEVNSFMQGHLNVIRVEPWAGVVRAGTTLTLGNVAFAYIFFELISVVSFEI